MPLKEMFALLLHEKFTHRMDWFHVCKSSLTFSLFKVIPDVAMMFGGTDAPCANAFFMCIGGSFQREETL